MVKWNDTYSNVNENTENSILKSENSNVITVVAKLVREFGEIWKKRIHKLTGIEKNAKTRVKKSEKNKDLKEQNLLNLTKPLKLDSDFNCDKITTECKKH